MIDEPPFPRDRSNEAISEGLRHQLSEPEKERLLSCLCDILVRRQEVRFAFVHGSFLEDLPFRDVDVAIMYDSRLAKDEQIDLSLELSVECSHQLGLEVDVHPLNTASLAFRFAVSRGKLLLAKEPEEAFDFMEDTWIRYFDFKPILEENLIDLLG